LINLAIRLAHIDCPKIKKQPYGTAAKKFTEFCFGKMVKWKMMGNLTGIKDDRRIYNENGINLNRQLVKPDLPGISEILI
jgi:endonuclease YncB( thermonuclease family)